MKKKKEMTLSEFVRKGGEATLKKYGREHYSKIAKAYWKSQRQKKNKKIK